MLIITGANGKLGRLVVEALLQRVPAARIGVSVRDPAQAQVLADRGVRVRRGDFAEPATLATAFEGASQVLVISSSSAGPQAAQHHGAAFAAAREAGAHRVLYTSHVGVAASSPFWPMEAHAATEAVLQTAGIPFTVLRNGFYADAIAPLLGNALTTGALRVPADGPVSWTAHADLAEATARLLTADAGGPSATLALTAATTYDMSGIAALLGELTGRPMQRVVAADGDYRDALLARGLPPMRADMIVGLFAAARALAFSRVDPTLEQLLGRPPSPLHATLASTVHTRA